MISTRKVQPTRIPSQPRNLSTKVALEVSQTSAKSDLTKLQIE
jgi:hypothetical protein